MGKDDDNVQATPHITNRRKARTNVRAREESVDIDERTSQQLLDQTLEDVDAAERQSKRRRGLQATQEPMDIDDRRTTETPRREPRKPKERSEQEIVEGLLAAQQITKVTRDNCFSVPTPIEKLHDANASVNGATMQSCAVLIEHSTHIYSLRVENVYDEATSTSTAISHAQQDGRLELNNGTKEESRGKGKKEVAPLQCEDLETLIRQKLDKGQKGRMNESDEDEEGGGDETVQQEDDEPAVEDEPAKTTSDEFMDSKGLEDIDKLLRVGAESRFEFKLIGEPTRFLSDGDEQTMKRDHYMENNYYHKASKKRGEPGHLLVYNAATSGRAIKLHPRTKADPEMPLFDDAISIPMAMSTWKLMNNSMLPTPQVLPNYLMPELPKELPTLDQIDKLPPAVREKIEQYFDFNDTLEDDAFIDMANDLTMAPAAAMEAASSADSEHRPLPLRGKFHIKLKGQKLERMWLPDELQMIDTRPDMSSLEAILESKKDIDENTVISKSEELDVPMAEIRNDTRFVQNAVLDDDLQDVCGTWNSVLVTKTVTKEMEQKAISDLEAECARYNMTPEQMKHRQRRILAQGTYTFFMDPETNLRTIPTDPYAVGNPAADAGMANPAEKAQEAIDQFDAGSDAGTEREPIAPIYQEEADDMFADEDDDYNQAADVDGFLDNIARLPDERPVINLNAPTDDIDDVPAIPAAIDEAIAALGDMGGGDEDDAHWKANKPAATRKDDHRKRDKETREQQEKERLQTIIDNLFSERTKEEWDELHTPYKVVDPKTLLLPADSIFTKKKPAERQPRKAYNMENFVKPSLTSAGTYGSIKFERQSRSHPNANHAKANLRAALTDGSDNTLAGWIYGFDGLVFSYDKDADTRYKPKVQTGDPNTTAALVVRSAPHPDEEFVEDEGNETMREAVAEIGERLREREQQENGGAYDDDEDDIPDHALVLNRGENDLRLGQAVGVAVSNNYRAQQEQQQMNEEYNDGAGGYSSDSTDEDDQVNSTKHARRIDAKQLKTVMRSVLTNRMLDNPHLNQVIQKLTFNEKGEYIAPANALDNSIAGGRSPNDSEERAILDVTQAVFAPVDDQELEDLSQPVFPQEMMDEEGIERRDQFGSDDRLPAPQKRGFQIDGEHTLSSMFAVLPFRMPTRAKQTCSVASALVIALHMCNENNMRLTQDRPLPDDEAETNREWMGMLRFDNSTPSHHDSQSDDEDRAETEDEPMEEDVDDDGDVTMT